MASRPLRPIIPDHSTTGNETNRWRGLLKVLTTRLLQGLFFGQALRLESAADREINASDRVPVRTHDPHSRPSNQGLALQQTEPHSLAGNTRNKLAAPSPRSSTACRPVANKSAPYTRVVNRLDCLMLAHLDCLNPQG